MSQCPFHSKSQENKVTFLIPSKNLQTDEDYLNIHSWLSEMRKHSPVHFDQDRQCWDVFLFEDVEAILKDHKNYSVQRTYHAKTPLRSILNMDPPEHTKLRRLVNLTFTPRALEKLAPEIEEVAHQLIDKILTEGNGKMDIVNDYAFPLTIRMLVDFLGVPRKDSELFKEWAENMTGVPKDNSEESYSEAINKMTETLETVNDYLLDIMNQRRKQPEDDLITRLVESEVDGEKLSEQEILDFAGLLLQAGFGTTARLISNSVRCILETPGVWKQLQEDSTIIPAAIEEVLRLYPSIFRTTRYALTDLTIQGQQIAKGDQLSLWIASANRDEKIYHEPDTFILNRKPRTHLAFGKGIHTCLGAALGRLEAKIGLEVLLERIEHMELIDTNYKPIKSMISNGLQELNVSVSGKNAIKI